MPTVSVNNQSFEVHEEVAEQFSKFIRQAKAKDCKISAMRDQINEAISCVHTSHEDDMGYDVLCSLGENP